MEWYPVAATVDIPEGTSKIVEVKGRSIGVYNVNGEYYAIQNYCPHQGAELCAGPVCGTTLESRVYEFIYGRDREIVRCPWHATSRRSPACVPPSAPCCLKLTASVHCRRGVPLPVRLVPHLGRGFAFVPFLDAPLHPGDDRNRLPMEGVRTFKQRTENLL
ncbi:Rieske (2Fe-2S) protein [Paenibacillus antri]|uniref:Rieske (2Fe-2S) protein n=1 Tax=Paenibacillus antri TaxID=2582848 RepID=UPI00192E2F1E|nr:Rieske 2Fe-2S domain-containing protein [Paenibacillus antri]